MLYIGIQCDVISRWELFQKMGKTFFKLSTIIHGAVVVVVVIVW
jgi:hypothetical protein